LSGLGRFHEAQTGRYDTALAEIRSGQKRSHWMWYIFPQLAGLGHSPMAQLYGIKGAAEARAYLADPVLGPRLVEISRALLTHADRSAADILGPVDAMKLRSCATLFEHVAEGEGVFAEVLQAFFGGEDCALTVNLLAENKK